MDPKATDILFEGITTLAEAYQLDEDLRLARDACFSIHQDKNGHDEPVAERIKDTVGEQAYQKIKTLEEKHFLNKDDPDSLNRFFEEAHNQISQTPKVQLQIAVELNNQILLTIKNWINQEVKRRVFLDIVQKPQILAGCVIVFEGAFRDYSIRKNLEENSAKIFKPIIDDIIKTEKDAMNSKPAV